MANIRFNLERDRSGSQKYIMMIYDISRGNRLKMSVNEKIDHIHWCKKSHRVLPTYENHTYVNHLLDQISTAAEKIRLRYKIMQQEPPASAFRQELRRLITPEINHDITAPRKYDKASYFMRFHDIMGDHINFKEAYYQVELEWNDAGVYMFPTYDAFRVGKVRYRQNAHKIKSKKAKGI
jgi:hypothetical protein